MDKSIINTLILFFLLSPRVLFAAGLTDLIDVGFDIVRNVLVPLAFSLCLLYFVWGVAKYVRGSDKAAEEGRKIMVWGIVGLFVAFSIWGIISFIKSELGVPTIEEVQKE